MVQHQFMVSPSIPRLIDAITQLYASRHSAPRRDATENKFPGFQRACTKSVFGWSFFYWISICRASVKNAWDGNTCIPVEHNTLNEIA